MKTAPTPLIEVSFLTINRIPSGSPGLNKEDYA
jgi:hypothetical protein